jgi:hypothetical protein
MLDYTIPSFQLIAGTTDITRFVSKIDLGRHIFEIGSNCCWTGNLRLEWTPLTNTGLAESWFSPIDNPGVFRPDQVRFQLLINSYTVAFLYLDRYVYDYQTHTGTGNFYQIWEIPDFKRVSTEIEFPLGNKQGSTLGDIIYLLTNTAFNGASLSPVNVIDKTKHTGFIYDRLTTKDPIKTAQQYASKNWHWIYVDTQNRIADVSGDPATQPIQFVRAYAQVESKPVLDNMHFAAESCIVSGSANVPDNRFANVKINITTNDSDTQNNFGGNGDRYRIVTQTYKNKWEVFPELATVTYTDPATNQVRLNITDTSQFLYERKTIEYYYWQENPPYPAIDPIINPLTGTVDQLFPQITDMAQTYQKGMKVCTKTTIYRVKGDVFPVNAGTPDRVYDTSLIEFERLVETDYCKITYKPKGFIDLQFIGSSLNLYPDTTMVAVTAEPVKGGKINKDGSIPEKSSVSATTRIEFQHPKEPTNFQPEILLKEETYTATQLYRPLNYTPFVPAKPHMVNFKFLPDQAHANYLAPQVGNHQIRKRDAIQVTMPLPAEQLITGFIPLQRAWIGDNEIQIDEEIISLDASSMECKYAFTGLRIGGIPAVPNPPDPAPWIPGNPLYLVNQAVNFVQGQSVNYQLQVIGGTPPYTFSVVTTLPASLSLSSAGLITGVLA